MVGAAFLLTIGDEIPGFHGVAIGVRDCRFVEIVTEFDEYQ